MRISLLTFVACFLMSCILFNESFAQGTIQRQVKISNVNGNIVTLQTDTPTTSYTFNFPNDPNPSLTTASLLYGVGNGNMAWSSTLGADSGNVMMLTRVGTKLIPSWSSMSTAGFVTNGEPILTFAADNGSLTNNRVFSVGSGLSITNSGSDNGSLVIGNTGVLKLTAGSGISLSDSTGNIVISSSSSYASGTGTATRLAFWGPGPGITANLQDDSSLYWDNTNKRLSIGAGPSPTATLQATSSGAATANNSSALFSNNATSTTNAITKTGLNIQSTGNWTGTGATNIGLNVNATGGSTNYAALINGGNVGIGTSTPSQLLELRNGNLLLSNNNGTAGGILFQGTGTGATTLVAGAQGATNITLTLPTAAPTANGQVLSSSTTGTLSWITPSSGSSNSWLLTGNSGTSSSTNFLGTTDAVDLVLSTNNTRRMTVQSDGDIGIGFASPTARLHVRRTDGTSNARSDVLVVDHDLTNGTTQNGFGSNILFQLQTSASLSAANAMRDAASIGVHWTEASDNSRSAAMTFSTVDTAGALRERVRIASNGYVGVNNANPVTSMDINGSYATKQTTITLSNGRNDNIAIGNSSFVRIVGPTGAFSISGIASGTNGKRVRIANMTGQDWTIMDSSSYSTLGNRIETNTNSDILVRGPVPILDMIYDSVTNQWLLGTLNANQVIGAVGSIVYQYKTADESVTSSATIQDDDHLFFSVNANETWELSGEIQADNASNNVDIKVAFQLPTGAFMRIYTTGIQDAGGNAIQGNGLITTSNATKTMQINGGVSTLITFRGIFITGSNAGSVKFRWSQGTSNSSTTTVRSYSYMKLIRVK